jgi:hypothetical protein
MAAFPAIEPDARVHVLPGMPSSPVETQIGWRAEMLHGRRTADGPLSVTFSGVSLTTCQNIEAHFLGQRQHVPFQVPPETWTGYDNEHVVNPFDVAYRYAAPPRKTITSGGLWDVTVELATSLQALI